MNSDLKNNFTQAATMLTKLFNSANQHYKEAYAKGQRDMINEIVQFCLQENNNLKTIELSKLDIFLQQKLQQIQDKQNQQQQILDQMGKQASNQAIASQNASSQIYNQQQACNINKVVQQEQQSNQNVSVNLFQQRIQQNSNQNMNQCNIFKPYEQRTQIQNYETNLQQQQNIKPNYIQNQFNQQQNQQQSEMPNFNSNQMTNNIQNQVNNPSQNIFNANQNDNPNFQNRKIFQIKGYKAQQNNVMNEEQNS